LLEHFGAVHRFSFRLCLQAIPVVLRLVRPASDGPASHAAGIGLKSQTRERVNEVASYARIWPIVKTKKRGSRERSSPPCQIRTFILPRCPEARGNNFYLDLTLTRKFFELPGHTDASLSDHVCAPSNGIQAAVYDSIGPAIATHDRQ
jgi:hypothetical protein